MLADELKDTVSAFRQNIDKDRFGKFIIYGTGINAAAVVRECGDYPIAGIMDVAKTGQYFCGLRVLSFEEILEKRVSKIVVIARPAVHTIIYKRIREWCLEHQIEVFDIYGKSIEQKLQNEICDSPYFDVSYEKLIREIDAHEIISFDIFDTILMRRVYDPGDVFSLVDAELEIDLPDHFSDMRKRAEQELQKEGEPDIYDIYERMRELYHLPQKICRDLMERELRKERQVLVVREKMKECVSYCINHKKRVFFVSDMYLPSEILREFMTEFGIAGYEDILVSCEHRVSKSGGLFELLKKRAGGQSCLHIGDNEESDCRAAIKSGIDAFHIMSAIRMLEISAYKNALTYLNKLESRGMLGMLAAEVFNNPFALYHSQGKPVISDSEEFGYVFIAPLIISFLIWMLYLLRGKSQGIILFSARDGWIIQKAYQILKKKWGLTELPEDIYFMISRKAVLQVNENPESQEGAAYRKYLESTGISRFDELYYFDFMSRGTCQAKLENILGRKMTGVYFQKRISGKVEMDELDVKAYFGETSAMINDLRIYAMCDFLECIVTSYQPSFLGMEADGRFVYDVEKRSEGQLECLKEIHRGIFKYCRDFTEMMGKLPENIPHTVFCDEILRYTSTEYSVVEMASLKKFMLDDWLYGDKNVGQDILL